jgi:hypothetical protein
LVGFCIRKSLSAGPFRFNLSKAGVGVTVGVPGFRVGTGPRGNYVHMGRGGVYYRATLGGQTRPAGAHAAVELAPTGGGDVVDQLNTAAARIAWGWWATRAAILIGLLTQLGQRPAQPVHVFLRLVRHRCA